MVPVIVALDWGNIFSETFSTTKIAIRISYHNSVGEAISIGYCLPLYPIKGELGVEGSLFNSVKNALLTDGVS